MNILFVVSVAFNSFVHADTKIWKFEGRKKIFRDHISTDYCQQVSSINNSKHQITLEVMASVVRPAVAPSNATFKDKEKPQEVRKANILAARAVSDAIRTSLGPKGMDKMIRTKNGEIIISNDGATILKHMAVLHPAARMLVDVSHAQDVEAGDGTTTVAILTGAFWVQQNDY